MSSPHYSMRRLMFKSSRPVLAFLCTVALLTAQWVGWQHRVAHAERSGWLQQADAGLAQQGANHNCAAFDALALGAAAVAHPPELPQHRAVGTRVLPAIGAQSTRSFDSPFQSRAPPVFL